MFRILGQIMEKCRQYSKKIAKTVEDSTLWFHLKSRPEKNMSLKSCKFLPKMPDLISFNDTDNSLLKFLSDWGKEIALEVAEQFYDYLSSYSCMSCPTKIKVS